MGTATGLNPRTARAAARELLRRQRARQLAAARFTPWVDNPTGFITEILGQSLWSGQQRVATALVSHKRVAVPAAHSMGKSFLAGRLVAWWLAVHPPGSAMVVSTAPTGAQVRSILWKEIRRARGEGDLPGRVNLTEWWMTPPSGDEELVGMGRKPADGSPGAFQGVHAEHLLAVIDEADEVHPEMFEAVETLLTNKGCKVLAIGNPVWPDSRFAQICARRDSPADWTGGLSDTGWWVERLDGLKSPNFTDEPIPPKLARLLLSPDWVTDYATRHGDNSPAFLSRVRGQHPTGINDGVIPSDWLRDRCQHRTPDGEPADPTDLWPPDQLTPVELGVDIGAGSDLTVIWARAGRRATRRWDIRSHDPADTVALIEQAIHATNATAVKVDAIGVGWGIVGTLREHQTEGRIPPQVAIHAVNVAAASTNPARFRNLRAQLWWEIGRDLTESGTWDLSDVPTETILELATPRYSTDAAGKITVEAKAEIRKRLGHSPDDADALLLAYLSPPAPPTARTLLVDTTRL